MADTARHAHSDPGEVHVAKPPRSNLLPPRSPLLGREHEVTTIQQILLQEEVGLLTLTGPGGIGKTRLALQVAANRLDHFVDGIYFVSLAPISEPDLVIPAIAQTLGVREAAGQPLQESLQDYLHEKQLLLVLDNFEQVVAAAPSVAGLLAHCRRLKVLVTSRAYLHLSGEHEFSVPPLALPRLQHIPRQEEAFVNDLAQVAAVALFIQRARAVKTDFALTATNAAAVAEICVHLDGLPLAIELAAVRIKLFSPQALLGRLQQRLTLLTGGPADLPARQRTLRDAIAWSYDLLPTAEQTLFRRLAVFVGGFTLEAAQALGYAPNDPATSSEQALDIDVLEGIASLVNKNLLKQVEQSDGEPRFRMLETIREYGLERLTASAEVEAIRQRHADFFLALSEAAEPALLGPNRALWLARLEGEHDNLREALAWSQAARGRGEVSLRLAGGLTWFWMFGNHVAEARGWFVSSLKGTSAHTAVRAKALWGAGLMAVIQSDYQVAHTQLEESVAIGRRIADKGGLAISLRELGLVALFQGDLIAAHRHCAESVALGREASSQWDLALALHNLGHVVMAQGDQITACALFEECHSLYQGISDGWGCANALLSLGLVASQQRDYATARAQFEAAVALFRAVNGDKWNIADALDLLGEVVQRQGELEQASEQYAECLMLAHEVGNKARIALVLYHLATVAQVRKQYGRAASLFATATGLRAKLSIINVVTLTDPADYERDLAAVRMLLGEEAFAARWAAAQALTLEQAIGDALARRALGAEEPKSSPPMVGPSVVLPLSTTAPAGLSAREVEVLRLLAQGLTYAQIADQLIITRRTVNAHLTSIYGKLGVTSRAAATRFALDHHLV